MISVAKKKSSDMNKEETSAGRALQVKSLCRLPSRNFTREPMSRLPSTETFTATSVRAPAQKAASRRRALSARDPAKLRREFRWALCRCKCKQLVISVEAVVRPTKRTVLTAEERRSSKRAKSSQLISSVG